MKKTKFINFFGGPGLGKSTLAAGVFSRLKELDIDCELVIEQAKILTWSKRQLELACQPYVHGKQLKMLHVLNGQVDFVLTDSPTLLSAFYSANKYPKSFTSFVVDTFHSFDNINFLLTRQKKYNPNGRNQTLAEAKEIDKNIQKMLAKFDIEYTMVGSDIEDRVKFVVNEVLFGE
jgi:hypothetical protein